MPCLYFIYSSKTYVHVHARKNYATAEIHPKGQDPPYWAIIYSTYTPLTTSVWLCHRQPDKKSKKRVIYKGYFNFLRPLFYLLQNRLYLFTFFRRATASVKQARSARHETRPTWEAPTPVARVWRSSLASRLSLLA